VSDQERTRRIEGLLSKHRAGPLTKEERAELEALVDADYREAIARADRLIAARKKRRGGAMPSLGASSNPNSSRKAGKSLRT
jgi:hypothetical protein